MAGNLTVLIPRPVDGNIINVSCLVHKRQVSCPDNPQLEALTKNIHLDTGHHADRDLEYAQLLASWFGGTVEDNRKGEK